MNRPRRVLVDPEPCTIGEEQIAEVLRRIGWHEAAGLVRHVFAKCAEQNREAMQWRQAYMYVLEQLHKYEPPPETESRVSHKPPPEASD